ncbi:MAG: hypothetical protein KDD62_09075 [Bdellovibrionales bacterium]|nr:hypothetical protein [Bdellovibrionales bacterium]
MVSRSTYLVISFFLLLLGYFFFTILGSFNAKINEMATLPFDHPQRMLVNLNQSVVEPYWHTVTLLFLVITPLIAMKTFAGERQHRTWELLATCPISYSTLVWGKFLGALSFLFLLLGGAACYPMLLCLLGEPERAPIFVGFFGVCMAISSFTAIAVCCSAFASTQLVAAISAFLVLFMLYGLSIPKTAIGSFQEYFVSVVSPIWHLRPFVSGVITLEGVLYFLSVCVIALMLSRIALLRSEA